MISLNFSNIKTDISFTEPQKNNLFVPIVEAHVVVVVKEGDQWTIFGPDIFQKKAKIPSELKNSINKPI